MQIFTDILNNIGINYTTSNVTINGIDPVIPTAYQVGNLGASALASVGYAASELWLQKTGHTQNININVFDAALSQLSHQYIKLVDGPNSALWDPLSGFYQTADKRYIQLHCNFPHHRQGVVNFLKCTDNKDAVIEVIKTWNAFDLETALNNLGLCASMVRSHDEWKHTSQALAIVKLPLLEIIKIKNSRPIPLPQDNTMPLAGIRALDLTRVIAGPVCGRTLAELGATVMRIDSPNLPEISQLALDTGRGKLSAHLDLNIEADKKQLQKLIGNCDIFSQAYRPGAMNQYGFSAEEICKLKPGIIYVSLSAYSHLGPWSNRHGYDSLVQSATGIAYNGGDIPKHLPCQTLDYVAGFISAFGAMEALRRRAIDGGSYLVRTSLVQIANYLINLGLENNFEKLIIPDSNNIKAYLTQTNTPLGLIEHLLPALHLSTTNLLAKLPVIAIGSSKSEWPS